MRTGAAGSSPPVGEKTEDGRVHCQQAGAQAAAGATGLGPTPPPQGLAGWGAAVQEGGTLPGEAQERSAAPGSGHGCPGPGVTPADGPAAPQGTRACPPTGTSRHRVGQNRRPNWTCGHSSCRATAGSSPETPEARGDRPTGRPPSAPLERSCRPTAQSTRPPSRESQAREDVGLATRGWAGLGESALRRGGLASPRAPDGPSQGPAVPTRPWASRRRAGVGPTGITGAGVPRPARSATCVRARHVCGGGALARAVRPELNGADAEGGGPWMRSLREHGPAHRHR